MRPTSRTGNREELSRLDQSETEVLGAREERAILQQLAECKRKLSEALASIEGVGPGAGGDDPAALANHFSTLQHRANNGPEEARLGAIARRYSELRGKLALANMRLVAHVAKRFRERGVAYSDLLQEGFCGLLEAIDRFDLTHETKLATYATWWIRQSMQRAVAAGAYPVRLTPRHLRQLAQCQEEIDNGLPPAERSGDREPHPYPASTEMIRRIHAATRPTVSLDATLDAESQYSLLQSIRSPEGDQTRLVDRDETVGILMEALRPREKEVLALRFGLGGATRLSLSQVGKVLAVSKERVRQIQDRALEKLRASAEEHHLDELLALEP